MPLKYTQEEYELLGEMLEGVKDNTSGHGADPETDRFQNNILMCASDNDLLRSWIGKTEMGRVIFKAPKKELPKMINHRLPRIKTAVRWRLALGK